MIEGVSLHPLKHIVVPKGDIYHAMKSTDEGYVGFGEVYFSQIEHGQAKGWKRHNRMTLNLIVPEFEEFILSPEMNYQRLTVPPGIWIAFYGVGEGISMLMDIIPEPHDPSEADRIDLNEIVYNF